jgi:hypothetical protein
LIDAGFALDRNLLHDAIQQENEKLIHRTITGGFYVTEDSIEVDFWYLIKMRYLNYAKAIYDREEIL